MGTLLRTLALVKPDAVRLGRALDIRQRAELEGFTVLAQERIQARAHCQQGCQSTFFGDIC
jgi:nucleoside diphosphate kinase